MYTCPHCGKATFVGGGTCNHCAKVFWIARLEDVFMKTGDVESEGTRVVPGDSKTSSHVVLLLRDKSKKPKADKISIMEFRASEAGYKHWTSTVYDLPLAGEIAKAVLEVAP